MADVYLTFRRIVTLPLGSTRRAQVELAAEVLREHADMIAENSLLRLSRCGSDNVLTLTVNLSNPQPDLKLTHDMESFRG